MSVVQIETSRSATAWATGFCLDCTSLARAALPRLALNPLKANYKTITVITFPTMTMEPVVEAAGAREQAMPSALPLRSSPALHSSSPAAAVISISCSGGD